MSMMEENALFKQHQLSVAKSKKQSNNDSNNEIRRNIRRTLNTLKTHSNQSLVDQHNAQNGRIKHNIMNRKQTEHLLSKKYSDTIDQTSSFCRNPKIGCYENISIRSKQTKKYESTLLDHREIKKNMITYSKDYISDNIPINKYKAIFYKDLCISGKNMSLWKRIKYRLRSLTSVKVRSHTYIVSTGLSRTFSTCADQNSNDVRNHLKITNSLDKTKDTPFSKDYITMHLNVEKCNSQQLINDNSKVYSKLKGAPCMFYDTKCMKLPVLNFPESYTHGCKNPIKAIVKTKISEILKELLATLVDKRNTQCDKIISTSSCKIISGQNRKTSVRKSKSVAANTSCKDKCIPNQNEVKETCKLCKCQNNIKSLQTFNKNCCNAKTNTNSRVTNKNKRSQVPKCKLLSKNIQGISLTCKSTNMTTKPKCSMVNTNTTPDKKNKKKANVRRHAFCKCVKSNFFAQSKDGMNQLIKKHGKSRGSQHNKPNHKKSKQTNCCKPIKRKSSESLTCNKLIGKKLRESRDETREPVCRHTRTQIPSSPKHDTNRLVNQKNTYNSCEFQQLYSNPNTNISKQDNFRKILNLKKKDNLPCCYNQFEKILSCTENCKPISHHSRHHLSKRNKYPLARRKSCSSYECPSVPKPKEKNCRDKDANGKLCMKNTYTSTHSKNIRSDMDIRCKASSNLHDNCSRSCCRYAKGDLNSCSTQRSLTLKRPTMCKFEGHVGDCTNNLKCRSRSCLSNCQMLSKQCQTKYCSDNLLTESPQWYSTICSIKRQLFHDTGRTSCTIPQNHYCKSCLTSLPCNANTQTKSLELGIRPRICTCTKIFNKSSCHKPKTKCAVNKKCRNKLQKRPSLPCHPHRNRIKHYYPLVGFFEKITNWCKNKRCQKIDIVRRKNVCEVDCDRSKLYEYAFRQRPESALHCMRPVVSPSSKCRGSIWQQCSQNLGLICVLCLCSPLFFMLNFFRLCD